MGWTRSKSTLAGGAAALLGLLVFPAAGSAVTIGSNLKGTPGIGTGYGCGVGGDPCSLLQASLPGDPHKTRAPYSGVIRKWRFRTTKNGLTYHLRLRVARKIGPGEWRFIRHTGFKKVGPDAGTYAFGAHKRIRKGDFIALDLPPNTEADPSQFYVPHANAKYKEWFPAPLDGPATMPDHNQTGLEYFYNATIRHRRR